MPFGSRESRKALLTMVSLVVVLDAIMIVLRQVLGIAQRSNQMQVGFVAVWILATLAIVVPYMKRIRQLRDAAIGRRRPARP